MNRFFKDAVSIIKNYKWNSMFFRYFKQLFFIIILPTLIFIGITMKSYVSSIESDISASQRYNIIKTLTQFDKVFDDINILTANIISSPKTTAIASDTLQDSSVYEDYSDFLSSVRGSYNYINSISVYNPKTSFVVSTYGSDYVTNFRDTSWLKTFNEGYAVFLLPAYPYNIRESGMISVGKNLLINGKSAGVIVFTVDGDILCDQLYAGNISTDESLMLFDENDKLIYSSDNNIYSENSDKIKNMLIDTTYREEFSQKIKSKYFHSIASQNHLYKIMSSLSLSSYKKKYTSIASILITYLLITIILVILLSLVAAFSFYRSIVDIVIKTSEMNVNNEITPEKDNNELMFLSDTLLNTIKNHQEIEHELVEKISKLKKVQSIALQTQINPHFLFNSLNLVNGFILEECHGESRAATIVSNISDILYIALNTKEYIVSVENEVEYAKKYLEVEQIKYPDKFNIEYDIDPETLNLKTVKFVLQPIIENAIEHGIKQLTDRVGVVTVSSQIINNKLLFSVSDDGPKIPDDKLKELKKRLESEEIQENKHIGLSNVNQRIKLIFGDEYGVSIYSDDNQTVIDIIMPVKE